MGYRESVQFQRATYIPCRSQKGSIESVILPDCLNAGLMLMYRYTLNLQLLEGGNAMRIIRVITVIMAVVFALNMAACCGPDTTEVKKTEIISQPTVGQQLEDLDKAYKNGAITKEEYDKTKQDILNRVAQPKTK